ncbi:hypothetical protein [Deinococcus yavapaiensis]|uniref:Uncharacterized protein n=1 Tax=Deinococcus yavapaiensis KR-236 TaxID=694435 RepID=A0A318SB55_9DEIO|nr:hypothetical protein [Deinococcus yavapaiensis]PYE56660.1 hypothetical protein DES52_101465 [Deinococcus yavapaiensis KR-236]
MTPAPRRPAPRAKRDFSNVWRWTIGLLGLVVLAAVLLSPLEWQVKLAVWIVAVLLLDECGNWFGYTGALLGALPLLAGLVQPFVDVTATAPQWYVAFPLIVAGLVAALLVKHAGGWFGLPFAAVLLLAPLLIARQFGSQFDETVTLPQTEDFWTYTLWPTVAGLVLGAVVRVVTRRREGRSAS